LRKLYLLPGAVTYVALVVPWYIYAEARNPGYLSYYFWDEHFIRYFTEEFNRSKDWYYFSGVLALGFLPWTALLPLAVYRLWRNLEDGNLFLVLWIVSPMIFFSASKSQLPHYILPIFPALACIVGRTIALFQTGATHRRWWPLYLPWAVTAAAILCIASRALWPALYSVELREKIADIGFLMAVCALALPLFYLVCIVANAKGYWRNQLGMFSCSLASTALFVLVLGQLSEAASVLRSTRVLAENVASHIPAEGQIALFNVYLAGLPFYLKLERPIWIAAERGKSASLGSPYVARFQPAPAPGYGKVLYNFGEFKNAWDAAGRPIGLLLKAKNIASLKDAVGIGVKEVLRADNYVLMTKP
jgi:4-amino-4-deoxy-L-arabinose transferase-like glycosyltransferase